MWQGQSQVLIKRITICFTYVYNTYVYNFLYYQIMHILLLLLTYMYSTFIFVIYLLREECLPNRTGVHFVHCPI